MSKEGGGRREEGGGSSFGEIFQNCLEPSLVISSQLFDIFIAFHFPNSNPPCFLSFFLNNSL
jgi:hypothetical protein